MRIAVAVVSHEACTFNPAPTDLERFRARCLLHGQEVVDDPPAQAGHLRGFVKTISDLVPGVELVPSIAARTTAGGRLTREALDYFREEIVSGLRTAGELDGIALCLHGASAADGVDDVESHLLKAVRAEVGPDIPIGVPLDHHANITDAMIEYATFLIGDRYQPHDKFDTGRLLAEMLVRVVRGEVNPVMVHRKLPLISHQEQYLTSKPPMKTWFDLARVHEAENPQILSVSNFPMQPWLDVEDAGYSVVVVADADVAVAGSVADELADLAWSLRAEFQTKDSVTAAEAVELAAASDQLAVVSDTGDSVGGGSGGDSTTLLEAFLAHGGPRVLIPLVHPPIAELVDQMIVGQTVTIEVGGAVSGWWNPMKVTGVVHAVESDYTAPDGASVQHVTSVNPLPYQNSRYCGPTVALEVGNVMLVISEQSGPAGAAPIHYTGLGIDVDVYDAAVLKTASNFQFWSEDLSTNVIRVNTPGPTQSDIVDLPWTRIPRPTYPLNPEMTHWR